MAHLLPGQIVDWRCWGCDMTEAASVVDAIGSQYGLVGLICLVIVYLMLPAVRRLFDPARSARHPAEIALDHVADQMAAQTVVLGQMASALQSIEGHAEDAVDHAAVVRDLLMKADGRRS